MLTRNQRSGLRWFPAGAALLLTAASGHFNPPADGEEAETRFPKYAWEMTGPGGGGNYPLAALSADGTRLLVSTDMGSSMVNVPGTWKSSLVPRRHFGAVSFHPSEPALVLASDFHTGLFRSTDGGTTWSEVSGDWQDYAEDRWDGRWPPPMDGPVGVRFSPAIPDMAVAVFRNYHLQRGQDAVFTSTSAGRTWVPRLLPDADSLGRVVDAVPSVADPGGLLIFTSTGVYRLRSDAANCGAATAEHSFDTIACGLRGGKLLCYGLVPAGRRSGKRLFVSADEGVTWEERTPEPGTGVVGIGVCGARADTAYFSVADDDYRWQQPEEEKWRRNAVTSKLYRTDDAFRSWRAVLYPHPDMREYNVTAPYWGERVWGWHLPAQSIAVASNNPDIVVRAGNTRVYATRDGGATWTNIAAPALALDGSQPAGGLPIMSAWGYHIDPHEPRRHFISMTDFSGWRSTDSGRTWRFGDPGNPFPHNWYDLVFDPDVPGRLWAAAAKHHDLPHPKFNGTGLRQSGGCVIYSENHGVSWTPLGQKTGLPNVAILDLELDPHSPIEARRMWAAALGEGLFVSTDSGQTWRQQGAGMDPRNANILRVRMDRHGRLFALTTWVVPSRNPRPGGLYVSTDGGATWEQRFRREDVPYLWDFATDPSDPSVLYLCAFTQFVRHRGGGLWKSTDGGMTWSRPLADKSVATVTVNPANPRHLFACAFWDGLYESADAGSTWRRIDSFPFQNPYKVVLDPRDPGTLFVCCFGSSIWRGRVSP